MTNPIHPGDSDGRSPWEKRGGAVPPAHKGPGKDDDGIPRDAAGETYMDRVRNINAQLAAMDLDLQRIYLEHMADEQHEAEALAAANATDVYQEGDPCTNCGVPIVKGVVHVELPLGGCDVRPQNAEPSTDDHVLLNIDADEGRVVAGAAINREMMDDLTVAWNAYMTFGLRAPAHIHYMIQRVVEPLLVEWSEQAAKKGWFEEE